VLGLIKVDQNELKNHLDEMVKATVEETLNGPLDAEADRLTGAEKYERTDGRRGYRSGYYKRKPHPKTVT